MAIYDSYYELMNWAFPLKRNVLIIIFEGIYKNH